MSADEENLIIIRIYQAATGQTVTCDVVLYGVPFVSKLESMWHFIFLVRIHDGNLLKSPLSGCIYSVICPLEIPNRSD